ncbi:transcription elongation factor GreB [Pseudomonas monsensis]
MQISALKTTLLFISSVRTILQKEAALATNIITRGGHDTLKAELDHLWRVYRPEITQKVAWSASLGDRSENADYQYNKKLLREIDRRVRYLRKRLEDVRVVDYSPEQEGKVFFGAWVEVENDEGELKKFRIVGYDEIYGRNDYISIDSPMARALLKKGQGDEAVVLTPTGEAVWYVTSITYESSEDTGNASRPIA